MMAPPVKIMVSKMDTNALVFPDGVPDWTPAPVNSLLPTASINTANGGNPSTLVRPVTTKPIQIAASLAFGGMFGTGTGDA